MTRRSRAGSDDDARLDARLAAAWEGGAAALARVLDLDAGLARLQAARAGLVTGESAVLGGLGAVLGEIDELLAEVAGWIRSEGPARSAVTAYLMSTRQGLIRLQAGLRQRDLAKDLALQLAGGLEHALGEAVRTLARLPAEASPIVRADAEHLSGELGAVRARVPGLSVAIGRLFDEADDPGPRVPVPSR
jgi:hypothetical protein